jgi:hypothetical protein
MLKLQQARVAVVTLLRAAVLAVWVSAMIVVAAVRGLVDDLRERKRM